MDPSFERLVLDPGERRTAVREIIRSAEREVNFSVFRCDDIGILDELADAAGRNVRLRALVTPQAKNWQRRLDDLGTLLRSLGVEVRRYSGPYAKYHAKYLVADSSRAMVASLNFTRKCLEQTCDFLLLTSHPPTVEGLSSIFEADSRDGSASSLTACDTLIPGPELARSRLLDTLGQAKKSIRIIDHRVSDPAIVAKLRERQAAGVTVRVLGRGEIPRLLSHGKMLLVDDWFGSLGSISLSGPSLDGRRELAVVVRDPANLSRLDRFFEEAASARLAASGISLEWSPSLTRADDLDDEEE